MRQVFPMRHMWACGVWLALAAASSAAHAAINATSVTFSQQSAALEYLQALASGDAEALALTIHPDDLRALRLRILNLLRNEAKHNDSTIRDRLFGQGKQLDELEHLTDTGFYATLADRLYLPGRDFDRVDGVAAVPDKDGKVEVLVRGHQPRDRGKVQVVSLVTLKPYGKDWKAALPSEIDAQIDDLIEGRHGTSAAARTAVALRNAASRSTAPAQPGIVELLTNSQQLLSDGKCDEYYNKEMSPNFKRITGKKAIQALVSACQNSFGTREMLLATLKIVRSLDPHYEYEAQRATYDLTGQGLPFDHFVLEKVDKRWYVAE